MITEEQIEKAAFEETFGMYGESESLEKGFICGAKWTINEFLNNLWHPVWKVPEDDRYILCEEKYSGVKSIIFYNATKYNTCYDEPWDSKVSSLNITRWLYIDDLLPNKGNKSIQTIHLIKNIQDYNMNR